MQTAVEYLIEQIKRDQNQKALSVSEWMEVMQKVKQMEKQQIIDAANQNEFEDVDGMGISDTLTKGEQYYNETYSK